MNKSLSILYYGIAIAVCVCLTDWRAGQRAVASCPDDFATEVATENFFRINEPSSVFNQRIWRDDFGAVWSI